MDSTVNPLIQNGSVNSNLGQSSGVSHTEEVSQQGLLYSERFVEFMIDLMSQAPTRRYTHAILEDRAVLIKCKMAPLFQHEKGIVTSKYLSFNLVHSMHLCLACMRYFLTPFI